MEAETDWEKLSATMNAFVQTEILSAATRLGLFDFLRTHGPASVSQIADGLQLSIQGTRILMLGCQHSGLTQESKAGGYENTSLSDRYLVRDSADSMVEFVDFVHEVQQIACRSLFATLKEGKPAGLAELGAAPNQTLYDWNARTPEAERKFHLAMAEYSRAVSLPDLPELAATKRLLDIGGGDGSVSNRLCAKFPSLSATVVDLPSVVTRVQSAIDAGAISKRVSAVALDVLGNDWPSSADAVLLSHFVEIFDPERIQLLYRKARSALSEGGRIFVWTLTADTACPTIQAVKSSVYFVTTAGGKGMTYSPCEHVRWLEDAGFAVERTENHPATSHTLIVAKKEN